MSDRFRVNDPGNFNDAAKWSATSGGAGGASVPGSSDNAIYDSNSGSGLCTFDIVPTVINFDMQSGYTGTVDTDSGSNFDISTSGFFKVNGGTFNLNAAIINVSGDFDVSGGTFNKGTGRVDIQGSGDQLITVGANSLFNVSLNSTGGTVKQTDALVMTGDYTGTTGNWDTDDGGGANNFTAVNFDVVAGNFRARSSILTFSGNVVIASGSGKFTRDTSTVVMNTTANISNPSGGNRFFDLTFFGSPTITMTGSFAFAGTWLTGTGILTDGGVNRTLTAQGTITDEGITYSFVSGSQLSMNATSAMTLPGNDYDNVIMSIAATGIVSFGGNVLCGTFKASLAGALAIADMVIHNLTCTFVAMGTGTPTNNGELRCGSGILDCSGDINIADSDFGSTGRDNKILGESATIRLGDDWVIDSVTDAGVFIPGTSIVVADGTSLQEVTMAGNSFWIFRTENGAGRVDFLDALKVDKEFQLHAILNDLDIEWDEVAAHDVHKFDIRGSGSNHVVSTSMLPGTPYSILLGKHSEARHLDITDANITSNFIDASCKNSIDGGNNSANIRFTPHLQEPDNSLVSEPNYDLLAEPAIANCV